jgi:hypothetical protein
MYDPFENMPKDTDHVIPEEQKIKFKNDLEQNTAIRTRILTEEQRKEYYPKNLTNYQKRHTYMSDDGMYLYHLGIIDYL